MAMKELLETIVKQLVENPDEVNVTVRDNERTAVLELRVAKDDIGRIIGKQGKIANAIRTIMKAQALKQNKKVIVEIVDQ